MHLEMISRLKMIRDKALTSHQSSLANSDIAYISSLKAESEKMINSLMILAQWVLVVGEALFSPAIAISYPCAHRLSSISPKVTKMMLTK